MPRKPTTLADGVPQTPYWEVFVYDQGQKRIHPDIFWSKEAAEEYIKRCEYDEHNIKYEIVEVE